MAKFVYLLALVAYANAGIVKRGLADNFVGAISDVGSTVLPEDSMRNGCASVGLYNREKDGSPPRQGSSGGGLFGALGSGLARFGNTLFPKSGMEQGCINAGFYDPDLDKYGKPKYQGGQGGSSQMGGSTTNIYVGGQRQGQQQQTTTKTYKCIRNGLTVPCDPATLAQAQGK